VLKPDGSGGVSLFYVHTDHLNAPRRISRPSDNVIVWRWDSDPFGTTAANQDPDGDSNVFAYNLRLPGQYFDSETGLHYNYFRDYDPATGRYVQSDPAGLLAGVNTYAYVGANPISFSLNPIAGVRGAWWAGARIGGAINYGIQAATGATLGSLLYDACHDSEEERCKKVLKGCREKCLDQFVNDPDSLPGMGSNLQGRQRRCIRECTEAQNCFDF
jgi:RHS repeat-associated protein